MRKIRELLQYVWRLSNTAMMNAKFVLYLGKCNERLADLTVMDTFPEVITLCGSTRFADAFIEAQKRLTLEGKIVLSVGLFGHQEGLDMDGPVKAMLDVIYKQKIFISDRILVLNVGGYIGSSTRSEIEYSTGLGIPVDYLEPISPEGV